MRVYDQDGTKVIYNGVPVGDYKAPIVEGYFQAIDAIMSQGKDPLVGWQDANLLQ